MEEDFTLILNESELAEGSLKGINVESKVVDEKIWVKVEVNPQ